jgi:hypothetical protein
MPLYSLYNFVMCMYNYNAYIEGFWVMQNHYFVSTFFGKMLFLILTSTLPGVDVMITIFCDFRQFSAKKLAFFSKTNVMMKFLFNLALFRVKNAKFCWFFWRKNFKNHNIDPSLLGSHVLWATLRSPLRTWPTRRGRPQSSRVRSYTCTNKYI